MTLREWQKHIFSVKELIVGASSQSGKDDWTTHPIGMCPQAYAQWVASEGIDKSEFCFAAWRHQTTEFVGDTRYRRKTEIKDKKWIKKIDRYHSRGYYEALYKHKFVLSPRGNGIDTHRTYEALQCKAIPILDVKHSSVKEKYGHLPVLFYDTYKDLEEAKLEQIYQEMLDTDYNFDRLKKSYWLPRSPELEGNIVFWQTLIKQFNLSIPEKEREFIQLRYQGRGGSDDNDKKDNLCGL